MAEPAAQIGRAAHLPEQPGQGFGALGGVSGQEGPELFSQVHQDGAGFEHPDRSRPAAVDQGGDLGIGVGGHKAAAELVALVDTDQPGVIFGAAVAQGQQLLQYHRDLDPVGRGQGIELEGMPADRQVLVVGRPGDRPVDIGEPAAIVLVPGPDLGRGIFGRRGGFGRFGHCLLSSRRLAGARGSTWLWM